MRDDRFTIQLCVPGDEAPEALEPARRDRGAARAQVVVEPGQHRLVQDRAPHELRASDRQAEGERGAAARAKDSHDDCVESSAAVAVARLVPEDSG
jgi:hypothetical protein